MASTSVRKLRLLCLHGFRTSGKIMKKQMKKAKWIEAIGDLVEFIFIDAVWFATGPSNVEKMFDPPYFEWYQVNKDFSEVQGVDEAVDHIEKAIEENDPIDGFVAFSQGAILGCALIGLQEKDLRLFDTPSIRMVVVLGGACSQILRLKPAYYDLVTCPSLHIIGEADKTKKKAETLARHFKEPILIRHAGGRIVPVLVNWVDGQPELEIYSSNPNSIEAERGPPHEGDDSAALSEILQTYQHGQ